MNKILLLVAIQTLVCVMPVQGQPAPTLAPRAALPKSAPNSPRATTAEEGCCGEDIPGGVLAKVNGTVITRQEVEDRIRPLLVQLNDDLTKARRKQLDLLINGELLEQEARRRSITSIELLQQEVLAKVAEPTKDEALAFYKEHQDQFDGEFDLWTDKIMQYMTILRQSAKAKELADRLRADGQVKLLLEDRDVSTAKVDAKPFRVWTERTSGRQVEAKLLGMADDKVQLERKDGKRFVLLLSLLSDDDQTFVRDPEQVLALVGDKPITLQDADRDLAPTLAYIQQRSYELRKQALDEAIDTVLIQYEAQQRKITIDSLLKSQVTPMVKPVTEQDILEFYSQNQSQIAADIRTPEGREVIARYLRTVRTRQAQAAFAQQLRPLAALEVYLTEPDSPVYNISLDDQPTMGPPNALATVVVFVDFECQRCAKLHETLLSLSAEYGQRIRLVARDFPVTQHPHAFQAALAAEAAREQGRYWEYAALLFSNQSALDVEHLQQYASELGLDRTKFDEALVNETFSDQVNRDRRDGLRLGVRSTPIVFVNGRPVDDKSRSSLQQAIEDTLSVPAEKKQVSVLRTSS